MKKDNIDVTQLPYAILIYGGALPFIIGAILIVFGVETIFLLGDIKQAFSAYGLLIVSFIAGTHWGQQVASKDEMTINLFVTSNIIAIAVWLSYVMAPFTLFVILLMLYFAILLAIDYVLFSNLEISKSYFVARNIITIIVCIALGFAGLMA